MFRPIEPSSSKNRSTGTFSERVRTHWMYHHWMYQYYGFGLMIAQWAETCHRIFNFLILITNFCCVYWRNKFSVFTITYSLFHDATNHRAPTNCLSQLHTVTYCLSQYYKPPLTYYIHLLSLSLRYKPSCTCNLFVTTIHSHLLPFTII